MENNQFENSKVRMNIREGILFFEFRDKVTVSLDDARQIVEDRVIFTDQVTYPVLIDLRDLKSVDKDARDYFAKEESRQFISAAAFLVDSYISRLIGNMFLNFNKPPLPSKLFTSVEDAVKWLQQYKG